MHGSYWASDSYKSGCCSGHHGATPAFEDIRWTPSVPVPFPFTNVCLADFLDNAKSKRKEPLTLAKSKRKETLTRLTCPRVWATGHIDPFNSTLHFMLPRQASSIHARSNSEDKENMCKDSQDMQFYIQSFASALISNVLASTRKERDIQSEAKEFTYKHKRSFFQKIRVPWQMRLFSSTFRR